MSRYEYYEDLLSKSYEDVVEFFLQKYGLAQDDYFREKSYKKFMNNEIKSITKGKISRTSEGLYCHHIDEDKMLKISDINFVKKMKFRLTTKEKIGWFIVI